MRLVGKPTQNLSTARLPSIRDVLWRLLFHHLVEKRGGKKSIRVIIESVLVTCERERIPTQRIDSAERKLKNFIRIIASEKIPMIKIGQLSSERRNFPG